MRGLRLYETTRSRELRRAETPAENRLWSKLRGRRLGGFKFVRQADWPFFADFLCREHSLVVEIDGATHSTEEEIEKDARRSSFMGRLGYRILRFHNAEVFENLGGVCETILMNLPS